MKVKHDIDYQVAPYGRIAIIPKGTEVTKATNLPDEKYWVTGKWEGITDEQERYMDSGYGFLLSKDEVEE